MLYPFELRARGNLRTYIWLLGNWPCVQTQYRTVFVHPLSDAAEPGERGGTSARSFCASSIPAGAKIHSGHQVSRIEQVRVHSHYRSHVQT